MIARYIIRDLKKSDLFSGCMEFIIGFESLKRRGKQLKPSTISANI